MLARVAGESQRALEDEDDVRLRNRFDRDKADGVLHPRVNRIAGAQNVAEQDFGHRRDRGVFKIEVEAVSACGRLWTRLGDVGYFGTLRPHRTASRVGTNNGVSRTAWINSAV